MSAFGPLVTTEWLGDHLGDDHIAIVDASWRLPGAGAAIDDYRKRHIPGAVFFDIDAIADLTSDLPHMAPSPVHFAEAMGAMGVRNDDTVIVYDDQGCFSAARVWWTFRLMGHGKVAVLDGGLPKWIREARLLSDAPVKRAPAPYRSNPKFESVCDCQEVKRALDRRGDQLIIDARPPARFTGTAPEPREGLRSGAMPGAANVPFGAVLTESGEFRPVNELREIFTAAGLSPEMQAITSCGSGVTAAVLSLALTLIGHPHHRLYDGSWAEWGKICHSEKEFPVVA